MRNPRWWPIMWCWELKWEQRSSSQAEKLNALQRDTVNVSAHLLPPFCLAEECGFENNWKRSEVEEGQRIQRVSYLNTEAVNLCAQITLRADKSFSAWATWAWAFRLDQWGSGSPVVINISQRFSYCFSCSVAFGDLKGIMKRLCS